MHSFIIHYSSFIIHHSSFIIHYSLFTIHHSSFTIHHSLGRDSFLHSLLSVNHIGFHLYEYLRHFANAVRRMLGVKLQIGLEGQMYFEYNGRKILASSSFMGIEPNVMSDCLLTREYEEEREQLLKVVGTRRAIVSVAYLERLKGWPLQLQAILSLVENQPSLVNNVVFILVCESEHEYEH